MNNENNTANIESDAEATEVTNQSRHLKGIVKKLFTFIAVIGALLHIFILNFYPIEPWLFRSMHLAFGVILGFLLFKPYKNAKDRVSLIDWVMIIGIVFVTGYIFANLSALLFRVGVMPETLDTVVAAVGVLLVLELTRRTSGWALPILASIFILYSFAGPYLPGILHHNGYSFDRFITYIFSVDGVFGVTLDVSSKYILLFIIFGSFLQMSGVGRYFIDFSFSLAGGMRGGPAKVSILSSGLMGMMNGTSAGNAVATGSLTIPLMRRVGYPSRFAAATEATASAGGQIMIPIMGAGAFLMAEITGIAYSEIILAATIPALLYFLSVFFMVDFQAIKSGMKGLSRKELPSLKGVFKQAYLFIPVILLITALLSGYSVIRSGTVAIVACLVVSWLTKEHRMGPKRIVQALELGMRNTIQLLAVCATAGIIVGVISLTGVGMRFSSMLLGIADANTLIALIFAMFISVLLGMGMPTTAAYAVAASVVAPGLIQIGIEPLFAHMFVFYYAVMSAITPPVALAAYAAAGVAGTDPFRTGITAFKLGIAAFIVPYMFIYSPELMLFGSFGEIVLSVITASIGIYLLAAAVQAWFAGAEANIFVRGVLISAAILFIYASIFTDILAIFVVTSCFILQRAKKTKVLTNESVTS
ncbi:TRAP transporter permease [Texcoconibacillus texcoconensis]|uniref:TRAP transporter 4TM/12TM fusion protein n=1 Tax=Texcoconibacillus texcoconensis TaxID=1095777 RepID=A0A840QNW8_9BACI|nr:TRAP transporter permease [Texcoconibacillus texcoconensis]MBB5173033.1 TRAP transporter 4TM/12TM fusion protein [Texcoconibacillus texcoconensis]